ncbi:M81 family metallopeptidase [Devosia sp. ZB163]|uniref:M81 family metallopeptidase n=1 Tax=Devosia sp. ZB163 TaxID=3025938 RepID=UPI0023620231|nr:M81 family metallopeptidase [Devosia sp. ZB163]MDC9823090.1 M81 family metallopeptidase [Devosia sp. ZB163]
MRIFTASLATETNTFSPVPTDMASFKGTFYAGPGEHPPTPTLCSSPVVILRERGKAEGFTVIEGTSTWAEPGGLIRKDVFEALRDEILGQLKQAMPVDGVVLGLHGAMVANGYDDPEGDLLTRVREIVGPDVIIAAELDPHSHLTPKRVAASNILASFLEFPHTDFYERGQHVVDLALRAVRGEIRPVISTFDCQMIGVYPTSQEPTRSFVDKMTGLQGKDGILSVSFIHGFMAGDVPEMGSRMMVVSDGAPEKGAALAEALGREMQAVRGKTAMPMKEVDETLRYIRDAGAGDKPFVVADIWDNPGGGVAGDNTVALRAIIAAGFKKVGVATIWDPQAAAFCLAAGEGAVIDLRFGGKAGNVSGDPIDARVEVLRTTEAGWQSFGKSQVPLGVAAVVRIVGTEIDIILNTNRTQTFEPDIFTNLGIAHSDKELLLVKSTNHFYAGFKPVAREVLYARVSGPYPDDPRVTNYRKLTRPVWPRVDVFAKA